jgi:hypothetical protein
MLTTGEVMTTSQQSIAKKGPLEGFKVIEFASKGPAPLCAMLLGDTNARRECGCTTTRGKLVHLSSAMDRWKRTRALCNAMFASVGVGIKLRPLNRWIGYVLAVCILAIRRHCVFHTSFGKINLT